MPSSVWSADWDLECQELRKRLPRTPLLVDARIEMAKNSRSDRPFRSSFRFFLFAVRMVLPMLHSVHSGRLMRVLVLQTLFRATTATMTCRAEALSPPSFHSLPTRNLRLTEHTGSSHASAQARLSESRRLPCCQGCDRSKTHVRGASCKRGLRKASQVDSENTWASWQNCRNAHTLTEST